MTRSIFEKSAYEALYEGLASKYPGNEFTSYEAVSVMDTLLASKKVPSTRRSVVLKSVGVNLSYLVKKGLIKRVRRGTYTLSSSTKTKVKSSGSTIKRVRSGVALSSSTKTKVKSSGSTKVKKSVLRKPSKYAPKNISGGVFAPQPDDTYHLNQNQESFFYTIYEASRTTPQNIKLAGPHGVGKTEMAIQFAARHEMPILIMDCANVREARDWFGYKTVEDGDVIWKQSQFDKTVSEGNHVILLDEINRTSPNVLNTLLPLLDGRRFTYVEEKGGIIEVGPGTVFFCTMNEGAGYTGTNFMDLALNDRFTRVMELDYLPEDKEVEVLVKRTAISKTHARNLVDIANKVRAKAKGLSATFSSSISTRQLLGASLDFQISGPKSLEYTLANHFSRDGGDSSERSAVYQLIQGKYGDGFAA